jgi:PKD repeat protein
MMSCALALPGALLAAPEAARAIGPMASFTAIPGNAPTGQLIQFDGSGSSDMPGTIDRYDWDFGDGNTLSNGGAQPSHAYAHAGQYTVTLTVTDNLTMSASTTHAVTITDRAPTASFAVPSGQTLTPLSFDGSGSADPDGSVATWSWSFGDGSPAASGASPLAGHAYAHAGSYQVTLTVTDNSGRSASVAQTVTVSDRPPVPVFASSPGAPFAGDAVSFDATGSGDPDGTVTAYGWSFGDGGAANGPLVTHAYASAGTYQVTLFVGDDSGSVAAVAHTVTVGSRPSTVPGGAGGGIGGTTAAAFSPPRLTLARLAFRGGRATTRVSCPRVALSCTGHVTLYTVPKRRARKRAARLELRLGSSSFAVAGGGSSALSIRLDPRSLRRLAGAGRVTVRAYAVSHDGSGDTSLATRDGVLAR